MSKETFDQVDQEKAIEGVIRVHYAGINMRFKEIRRLEEELGQIRVTRV
jgi:hypothetical protein